MNPTKVAEPNTLLFTFLELDATTGHKPCSSIIVYFQKKVTASQRASFDELPVTITTVVSRTHASVVISFQNRRKERGLFLEPSVRYNHEGNATISVRGFQSGNYVMETKPVFDSYKYVDCTQVRPHSEFTKSAGRRPSLGNRICRLLTRRKSFWLIMVVS